MSELRSYADLWIEQHVRICNCRACNKVISNNDDYQKALRTIGPVQQLPEPIGGRIHGEPFCHACLNFHRPPSAFGDNLTPRQAAKLGKTS